MASGLKVDASVSPVAMITSLFFSGIWSKGRVWVVKDDDDDK
jgi:hypothetical protein